MAPSSPGVSRNMEGRSFLLQWNAILSMHPLYLPPFFTPHVILHREARTVCGRTVRTFKICRMHALTMPPCDRAAPGPRWEECRVRCPLASSIPSGAGQPSAQNQISLLLWRFAHVSNLFVFARFFFANLVLIL